jgi:UPF0755 protein
MKKIFISIIGITFLFLITSAIIYYHQWQPRALKEPVAFSIAHGQTLNDISFALKEKGIIDNRFLFELYGKAKGYDRKISEGIHYFHTVGMDEVYEQLMSKGYSNERIEITIPEGFNVEKIAKKLAEADLVNESEFLTIAKSGEGIRQDLLEDIPHINGSKYRLEGYFFPDTYFFQKENDAVEVVERMLEQFFAVINTIGDKPDLSLHEWVTLASIVEREAVLEEERAMIAGVFYNRLHEKWKLQACATVLYALGKPKERLLYEDLEIDSPYNTYILPGLPIGPIASPGLDSLKAVLQPKKHNYFYYVIKGDGSRGHNFSETYSQHQDYKEEALKQH